MIRINLLPVREARRKAGVRQQMVLLAATTIGAVVVCAAFHTWMLGSISATRGRVKGLEAQLAQYKPQQQQVDQFKTKKAEIEQKLAVIENLERSRSGPVHIMDELSNHIPKRVWLTDLDANNGMVSLTGMSLDNELVATFLSALDDSPYFTRVELQSTELKLVDELKLNTFKIRAALESPDGTSPALPGAAPAMAKPATATATPGRRPATAAH